MDPVIDENGNVKSWKIEYCGWSTKTSLLDEDEPFQVAHVSAHTADEAIKILKNELRLSKITVHGEPELELISKEEYENG